MEIYKANRQWAERPKDERFPTLRALYDATRAYAVDARTAERPWSELRTEASGEDVLLVGKSNQPAILTHWAFGQLAARVGAPANYLRELPPTLAVQNLNYGLAHRDAGTKKAQMLFHTNGGLLVRALTTEVYERVWNWEVASRMIQLEDRGWSPARPDTQFAPSLGRTLPDETSNFPALYASDHDMFAFLCTDRIVEEEGQLGGLRRSFIVENSEVGDSALRLTRFLYRMMCGNHIIWGASKVYEISLRHVGGIRDKWNGWDAELRRYADESVSDEEAKIARAKHVRIGATKDEVLDRLFGIRKLDLSRKLLTAGYEAQENAVIAGVERDSPQTQWGIVQGLTRHATTIPFADRRTEVDRAAGRILEIEF